MLGRDPRATAVLAEDAFPYRAIEVRGRIRMSAEPGMIAELEPEVTTCWDYADDFSMMPPTA
jgi:hypothetical protein